MTSDLIHTQSFKSSQEITAQQAVELEANLESNLLSQIDSNALTTLELKLAHQGGKLSEADTEALLKMADGLTAKDIDNLVTSKKISRGAADLLLAAGTLRGFNESTTTAADVTKGLNKIFVDMNDSDREFTLNTFAQQGDVARKMQVDVSDSGVSTPSYLLTANGQELGPKDLPTTAEIQRAAMFLMSDSGDATQSGAVQAFTNWKFDSADDAISGILKGLPTYEGLPQTTQDEFAKYIKSAGSAAAGYAGAANMDLTALGDAQTKLQDAKDFSTDLDAVLATVNSVINSGGRVRPDELTYTDAKGKAHTVSEFLNQHPEISFPNQDGDRSLNNNESAALAKSLGYYRTYAAAAADVQQMRIDGASDAEVAQAAKQAKELNLLANTMSKVREYESDTDIKDKKKLKLEDEKVFDPLTNKEISLKDALDKLDTIYADKNNDSGFSSGQIRSHNMKLKVKQQKNLIDSLEGQYGAKKHEFDTTVAVSRANVQGSSQIAAQLKANQGRESDLASALAALEAAKDASGGSQQINIKKLEFKKADGTTTNTLDYLKAAGIDFENKGRENFINNNTADDVIKKLKSEKSKVWTQSQNLRQQLDAKTPATQSTPIVSDPDKSIAAPQTRAGAQNASFTAESVTPAPSSSAPAAATPPAASAPAAAAPAAASAPGSAPISVSVAPPPSISVDASLPEGPGGPVVYTPSQGGNAQPTMDDLLIQHYGMDPGDSIGSSVDPDDNWDPNTEHSFINVANKMLDSGQVAGPDDFSKFGFSDDEIVDIGMLMFVVQSERMQLLGSQIKSIIAQQRANNAAQENMTNAIGKLNSAGDSCDINTTQITLKDGTTQSLKDFFAANDVDVTDGDGDGVLSKEEIQTTISTAKGKNDGLSNEGQMINNELTMLSSKYQQAVNLGMNTLEKFDAMKEKIIAKIHAG